MGMIMKLCSKCNVEKDDNEFYRHSETRDKLHSWCKQCHADTYRIRKLADPTKYYRTRMNAHYKREYGLDIEAIEGLVNEQGGKCGICQKVPDKLEVDHDHETGKVRGLLCHQCNSSLGWLGDSMPKLLKAVNYLLKRKAVL